MNTEIAQLKKLFTPYKRNAPSPLEMETEKYPLKHIDAPSNFHFPELDICWWLLTQV